MTEIVEYVEKRITVEDMDRCTMLTVSGWQPHKLRNDFGSGRRGTGRTVGTHGSVCLGKYLRCIEYKGLRDKY